MASATVYKKDSNGKPLSYRIRVDRGRDEKGNRRTAFSEIWTIPKLGKGHSLRDALEDEIRAFEARCQEKELADAAKKNQKLFGDCCRDYIDNVCSYGDPKPSTTSFYNRLLPIINAELGSMPVEQITRADLLKFYAKLRNDTDKKGDKAKLTEALLKARATDRTSSKDLQTGTGLCDNTIRLAFKGSNIAISSAERIADFYQMDYKNAFEILAAGKGYSEKYISHFRSFIHAVLEQAMLDGNILTNPAYQSKRKKKTAKHEAEFFELEDVLTIKSALDSEPLKYKLATILLIDTGMRRGELCGLRWSSFDYEKFTIKIEHNVTRTEDGLFDHTPKSGHIRTISFSPEIVPLLKEYQRQQKEYVQLKFGYIENLVARKQAIRSFNQTGYIFCQDNGNAMTPNALNQWTRKFSKKIGLHVYPHKFRHSQASLLIGHGIDIVTVSKRLGHSQVSTTQNIYAHLLAKSDKKASNLISDLVFQNKA